MSADDKYIILHGLCDGDYSSNKEDNKHALYFNLENIAKYETETGERSGFRAMRKNPIYKFGVFPEKVINYMNGKGEGKKGIFYEPVGNINFTFSRAGNHTEVYRIWTQTLKEIPSPSNANEIPATSTSNEIPATSTANVEETPVVDGGKKKPSRRKTRKNRRKY